MSIVYPTLPASASRLYRNDEVIGYDPTTGRRRGKVWYTADYSDLSACLTAIGGTAQSFTGVYGTAVRLVRLPHPDDHGMFAVNCGFEGTGSSGDPVMYDRAMFWVDFATPSYPITGDAPFVTTALELATAAYTIPGRALRTSDGYAINQDVSYIGTELAIRVTLHQCPSIDLSAFIAAGANPVNSVDLYTPYGTVAAGYGLFEGLQTQKQYTLGGVVSNEVSFVIKARTFMTWQEGIHPITGDPDAFVRPDSTHIFGTSDLNTLYVACS